MSDYIVSARKYRPDSFESLIGQDNIARTLKNSILRGQLAHAYLFCGPRGVGKTSAARIFAKTINCSNPTADMEPCGECESCQSFKEGRSYCIHELDAASNNGIEDMRALLEQVQIPPQVGKYSVFIIDEVHMLTTGAFNAFLKTLEEPPAHAIFILATTEKHKIIPTILSRCQTYDFNRISIPDIVRNLQDIAAKEGISADIESLHVIARKADGAMRDALTIFDQTVAFCGTDIHYADVIRNLNVLDSEYNFRLVDSFLAGDYATALLTFDEILGKGFNSLHFISEVGAHLRDLLVARTGGLESLLDVPDTLCQRYAEQGARCSVKFIYDALDVISKCEAGFRESTNQRLHIEYALMKLCFLCKAPAAAPAAAEMAPGAALSTDCSPLKKSASPTPPEGPVEKPVEVKPVVEEKPVAEEKPAPQEKPKARRKVVGMALNEIVAVTENKPVERVEKGEEDTKIPEMELIQEKWKELAAQQASKPRLASALAGAKLTLVPGDGYSTLQFSVINEAQKKWLEEQMLRSLEGGIQKLTGCRVLRLEPVVIPEEEVEDKKYMPAEKAQDLIAKNEEVKNLVIDLGLDIK